MNRELKILSAFIGIFLIAYFLPLGNPKVSNAILEAFNLLQWYARQHTLACVVPAMFIAGAITTFLSQASVLNYLGPKANRPLSYGVGAVSGFILAVCSCSVLPMFAGIYALGAGLGPACAFLYSGPAINVMAVFLSARVLGADIGIARTVGAVVFAVVIGLLMAFIFRKDDKKRNEAALQLPDPPPSPRRLWQTTLFMLCMILFLMFSDWYNTYDVTITLKDGSTFTANIRTQTRDAMDVQIYQADGELETELKRISFADTQEIKPVPSFTMTVHSMKWHLAGLMGLAVLLMVWRWFSREEVKEWMNATWDFAKMIVPLLFGGVFITGFVGALLPDKYVAAWVGGDSLSSNFVASFIGCIWYFATLTEIPIVEVLTRLGMGKGPALSLLLAGPALSLPSIFVLISVMGWKKTMVFTLLVVIMSTFVGMVFGAIF
ncbi:MAG: permease [Candidatus Omnitrophica bacterium]|nr:permease [Candidatus Omnitrophota bacterium]